MSAAVGSTPSLTRSGRPSVSLRSRAPSGRQSTTLRASQAAVSEGSEAMGRDARLSPPPGKPAPSDRYAGRPTFAAAPSPWSAPALGAGIDRMSDDSEISAGPPRDPSEPIPFAPPKRRFGRRRGGRRRRPKVRKLRLFWILTGLGALAVVSTIFGMMMAVASDLPQIENRAEYKRLGINSYLYDDHWRKIGLLAPPNNEVIDDFNQLGPMMRKAIVAVEDKRFWSDPGVDIKGIARAFVADVTGGARQGASTIAQQFVKNALAAEGNRTVFEKLREAALAYHLTREWRKSKILTEYLNSIYFGNGAYGAESAARVYFGNSHDYNADAAGGAGGCGDAPLPSCASELNPAEAALLAGMV